MSIINPHLKHKSWKILDNGNVKCSCGKNVNEWKPAMRRKEIERIIDDYPYPQSPVEAKGVLWRFRRSWLKQISEALVDYINKI